MTIPVAIKGGTSAVDLGAVLVNPALLNGEQTYHLASYLVNGCAEPDKVRESLLTRFGYELEKGRQQSGATMHDAYAGHDSPTTLYTSIYPRAAAGATACITYSDPATQEVYVLLARKPDKSKPDGLKIQWVQPGGYMQPREPGEPNSTAKFDKDLEANVLREALEETGIDFAPWGKPVQIMTNSTYGISDTPTHQTINQFFHLSKSGPLAERPEPKGSDDIAKACWVPSSAITFHPEVGEQPFGSEKSRYMVHFEGKDIPLRDDFGFALGVAVDRARSAMTQQFAHRMKAIKVASELPNSPFGPQAHNFHLQRLQQVQQRILGTSFTRFAQQQQQIAASPPTLQ